MGFDAFPGLAGLQASQQMRAQRDAHEMQQATGLMALMQHVEAQQQTQRTRALLAQSGGDPEKASGLALQAGDVKSASLLAPLMKEARASREAKLWDNAYTPGATPTPAPFPAPTARPGDINFMAENNQAMGLPPPAETPAPVNNRAAMAKQLRDQIAVLSAPMNKNPALAATTRGGLVNQEIARLSAAADRLDPAPRPMAPGHSRTVQMGNQNVTQELQPDGTWSEIGRGAHTVEKGNWSAPYQLGGATVQKNSISGEIRTAVTRPPQIHVSTPGQGATAMEALYHDYSNHPQVKDANDLEVKIQPLVDYMIDFKKTGKSVNANDAALAKAYIAVTTPVGARAYIADKNELAKLPNLGDRLGNMASSFFAGKDLTDQARTEMFNYVKDRYRSLDAARQKQRAGTVSRAKARGFSEQQIFGAE